LEICGQAKRQPFLMIVFVNSYMPWFYRYHAFLDTLVITIINLIVVVALHAAEVVAADEAGEAPGS
jgi:hypothetical protein